MEKRLACFVLVFMLSGCLGQAPAPQPTDTPIPQTVMPVSTTTPPPTTITPTTLPPPTVPPTTTPPAPPKDYNTIMKDLEKNFPKLASELKELPELKGNPSEEDLEALNDIYYLWKNATNPEVKEAFDLMIKGGTPSQKDFSYQVPTYNTELQILFWLAQQNDFHHNDTLAEAIAMVNGLWVTMGDDEVRKAVKKDTNDLLDYFRETNEWQRENGYYLLEDYPLEAKVALSWTGSITPLWGHYGLSNLWKNIVSTSKSGFIDNPISLEGYKWDNVSVTTLKDMRDWMDKHNWVNVDIEKNISFLEDEFYFNGMNRNWEYATIGVNEKIIQIEGEIILNHHIFNNDAQFRIYLRGEKVTGGCYDEASFIESWNKSWGIASTSLWHQAWDQEKNISGHAFIIYFNPKKNSWMADPKQLDVLPYPVYTSENILTQLYIFHPPIIQDGYLKLESIEGIAIAPRKMFFMPNERILFANIKRMFLKGVPTSQMKQWLLYP